MRKCCSRRVSRSRACRLSMPSVLKKSSSGASFSRGTLKCSAARLRISASVWSAFRISVFSDQFPFSRQIWLRVGALDELAQSRFDCWLHEQLAENIDLLPQLFVGDGLDEVLGCDHS